MGRVEGNWILNPTFQQLEFSTIDLVVSGSADSIVMVEGGSLEVSEAEILEALKVAQKGIRDLIGLERQLMDKAGAKPEDGVDQGGDRRRAPGPGARTPPRTPMAQAHQRRGQGGALRGREGA